jgi:ketosteroid isomerase-like protein
VTVDHRHTIELLVDAINDGSDPGELLTDDFRLSNATTAVTDATYTGRDGALKWRSDMFDVVEDPRFEVDEVLAEGSDYVVVANHIEGRGRSSGVPVDMRWTSAFWFNDDGKICRVAGFNRRSDALEAVRTA